MIANLKFPKTRKRFRGVTMKKNFLAKVKNNGITIPKDVLEGFNEGDLAEIQIKKVYADEETKKEINFAIIEY